MSRPPLHLLLLALVVGSCIGSDTPTGVGELAVHIPINPALVPSPADAGAAPINRIRAQALRASDNAVLGETVVDVEPTDDAWEIELDVAVDQPTVDIVVSVFLLSGTAQEPTVEFSGQVGPLTVTRGSPLEVADIPIVRGPLANLFVTGVGITAAPDTLLEGTSGQLQAAATSSSPTLAPQVYWTSLDSAVLSAAGSTATGVSPGTGRVVASAGAHSDTASIVVRPAPATILVAPVSDTATAVGQQVQYQARVVDARGDTLGQEQVTWRSATPQIVESLGGGLFGALAPGDGTIEAVSVTLPSVVGSAELVVLGQGQPANADVRVLKTVDNDQPLGGSTVTFTVSIVNAGPIDVTSVAVFDTLAGFFLSPSHAVTAGTLVGDSLWTIPALAVDDTARWTTTTTVAPDVAGNATSNRAILRSLAQNDTTPTNDTVTVAINFPLSAVPVVQIASPTDGAVFDPGDPVTFSGTATDAEDGDLTPQILWTSSRDGAIGTGRSFSTSSLSTGVHTITASVTDQTGGIGTATVTITIALITTPATLNVPFGGTASLPITLTEPAPAGGVSLSVVSGDATITAPSSPTVVIAQGALSGNATLSGLQPGSVDVTVANPQFGSAVSVVSVTAELDILGGNVTFATPFGETVTVQLESQGAATAAPAGGLLVTMTALDPTCVAVGSLTIPAGQISRTATLTYGGSATPPCQTYVRASAPGLLSDSVLVTVSATPSIAVNASTVGSGLQEAVGASLGVSNHGGTTVTVTSSDPQTLLVSPNATTPGAASAQIQVPNGSAAFTFYVQGVEGATGTPDVTATANSFANGGATMNVVQPGVILVGLNASLTTFSPDDDFYAYVGSPSGASVSVQNVRAGGSPLTVTFATDDIQTGILRDASGASGASVTATIQPGFYYTPTSLGGGGVTHEPLVPGTATITASAPGFATQQLGAQVVTVSQPVMSMSAITVGAGLMEFTNLSLGASAHGGTTVTLTSSNAQVLRVSANASTPGSGSIQVPVADGNSNLSFVVHALEGVTGSETVTATASGFVSGQATMTVVQPGVILVGLNGSATTLSPDDDFYAYVGVPSGSSVNVQNVRAGGSPVTVTFTSSDTQTGILRDATGASGASVTAAVPVGFYYTPTSLVGGGVTLEPLNAGTTTIAASAQGFVTQPLGSQAVTVTAPAITMTPSTVAAGLQEFASGSLGASAHGGTTLTLTSSDAQVLLVSPDAITPGQRSIQIAIPNGTSSYAFYVQGVEGTTGSATVTATASSFTSGNATMTVVQPGVMLVGLAQTVTTLSPNDDFYAYVGAPAGNSVNVQNVRAGGSPITVTFTSDASAVALLRDASGAASASVTATVPVGFYYTPTTLAAGGVTHDPQTAGSATITASAPNHVTQPAGAQTVTVSAPVITVGATTVGSGLQESSSVNLGATAHGGVTVTLTSSDPTTALVSPDASTAGQASVQVRIPDGTSSFGFYVQGVEGATGSVTVTATAQGFINGTNTISVEQPGIMLVGLVSTTTASAADDDFYAYVGVRAGAGVSAQNVRAGGSQVVVTATSSNPTTARLVTSGQAGASIISVIAPGFYYTPFGAAAGGLSLDPLAQGDTNVSVTAPGFITQQAGTQTVTINP